MSRSVLALLARRSVPAGDTPAHTAASLQHDHLEAVFAYVSRRVFPHADAEDVVADTFAAAFAHRHRLAPGDDPRPWLLTIARNKVIDHVRRHRRRPVAADDPGHEALLTDADTPEHALLRAERRRRVWALVDSLPPDQREALLLQHLEDLPHAQIAQVMGRSPAAVNALLQRARATLAARGADLFPDTESSR